ncbi:MAG: type II toxin-antitoxin system RelE/ParE family toxin [Pirellulales bacterium]
MSTKARADLRGYSGYISQRNPDAAEKWTAKIEKKCRLVARYPDLGDPCPEYGEGVRSTYVGSYVIYFRRAGEVLEIVRIIRGDRDVKSLETQ